MSRQRLPLKVTDSLAVFLAVGTLTTATGAGIEIDPAIRASVVQGFNRIYLPGNDLELDWTGTPATCSPGDISSVARETLRTRINYFRAMASLTNEVTFRADWDADCQQTALMMSAQGSLSHAPSTDWKCYTEAGAVTAGKANLTLGSTGVAALDLMMDDPGPGNTAAGHRRWLLFPPQRQMGAGALPSNASGPSSSAIRVIGGTGSRPSGPEFIAWPPPGFVPFAITPRVSRRWSFSLPAADFSSTEISVQISGLTIATQTEPELKGYGDNTLVWVMSSLPVAPPAVDVECRVTLKGVKVAGKVRDFSYVTTLITPEPELTIRNLGDEQLELAWRTDGVAYRLETGASIGSMVVWSTVTNHVKYEGTFVSVKVASSSAQRFFRLTRPGS